MKNKITVHDVIGEFSEYSNDIKRIKKISKDYKNINSISDIFSNYYNINIKATEEKNDIIVYANIEVGKSYTGTVIELNKHGIMFEIPGVKDLIISKENFNYCIDNVKNFLINNDNKLPFKVKEYKNGTYYVSVVNGMYDMWVEHIEKLARKSEPISVHIDSLTKGGYLCNTIITPLKNLTGTNYTSSVFIPGSNIVLNIERDFEQWVGKDVDIIPQKFVKYKMVGELTENSLIGSRKLYLQNLGIKNLYDIWNRHNLSNKLNSSKDKQNKPEFNGTVTGIINSNKKTGIFVELDDLYITGLMPVSSDNLLNYKPGDKIKVIIKQFEIQEDKEPFIFNKKKQVVYSNTRCVFEEI